MSYINEGFNTARRHDSHIYALNGRPSESMEQKLIESEREIKDSTVIIGDFNICSLMHLAKSTSLQRPSLLRGWWGCPHRNEAEDAWGSTWFSTIEF